ncbi:MAG: hypothetical protein QOE11_678 [Solirubrobacteraceae bacterium]|nr:hypothetical protein [Solirubrobacteraceae bacterium]
MYGGPHSNGAALRLAVTASVAAGLAGCGGGGTVVRTSTTDTAIRGPAPAASMATLLDHVPGNTVTLATIDLAAVKREIGLPADADPGTEFGHGSDALQTLAGSAFAVLTEVADPQHAPALKVLDLRQATAAVKTESFSAGRLILIATAQPPAQIARGLLRAGLQPFAANILQVDPTSPDPPIANLTHVAFGAGFVAITDSGDLARAVLARDGPDPTFAVARRQLDSVSGARRVLTIVAGNEDADAGCIRLAAGGERFDASAHDLVLLLNEAPDRRRVIVGNSRLTGDTLAESFALRSASVKGRVVRLKVASRDHGNPVDNGADAVGFGAGNFYRCKGLPLKPRSIDAAPPSSAGPPQSFLEERAAALITARSSASTRVSVTCPADHGNPHQTMRCTGTRSDQGHQYHYVVTLKFNSDSLGEIESIDVQSPDDRTGTIMDDR